MKILTLCNYCNCKLQVTSKDSDGKETTFICPACNKVNILDLCTPVTTATDIIVTDTGNVNHNSKPTMTDNVNHNSKPTMTEQLALAQLRMFCEVPPF